MDVGLLALLVGASVLFGAATQRITGMGFALVSSPALVLLLGAALAVPLIQVVGIPLSLIVLISTFRDISWSKAVALGIPALIGLVPGWLVARAVSEPALRIIIGVMIIIAILAMLADERARVFKGAPGLIGAGFLSGFMHVMAGVGGPAVVLYKLSTNWLHREFVATIQVYFIGLSTGAIVALGWPNLSPVVWVAALVGLGVGLLIGQFLTRWIPVEVASRLVIVVALAGAVATVAQGLLKLLA